MDITGVWKVVSLANSSCGNETGQTLSGLNSDRIRTFLFHRKYQESLKSTNFEHAKTLNSSLWKSKTEVTRKKALEWERKSMTRLQVQKMVWKMAYNQTMKSWQMHGSTSKVKTPCLEQRGMPATSQRALEAEGKGILRNSGTSWWLDSEKGSRSEWERITLIIPWLFSVLRKVRMGENSPFLQI